ncbi:hypothetical protein [Chryseobacterium viscerum]|uniref:YopX protein domain-containing protein n=1 Tax=Chryseobacterium viscerum TaxID=1037377 RepID=A0A5N4BJ49_9FLAO|nr:hypothetical protein [Chryseobacterium viscerum]KAB1228471.1 hypothetical protein F8D52_22625 [Chryseobacterium viscerum]
MKIKLKVEKEFDVKELHVKAHVRYWYDAEINGSEDTEGYLVPCRIDDCWCPIIDLETGIIKNWEIGKTADIHYKVCDEGVYTLKDEKGEVVKSLEGYVIDCMSVGENGYGDYIIMNIDENGLILGWKPNLEDFVQLENED